MKVGPKYKIAKRLGASVFEKTQTQKFAVASERRAKTRGRGRGPTEYGRQLLEKQKVRITYGLTERKFSEYVREAMRSHGREVTPAETLHRLIETRLDNVAYRLGLAPTRRAARQMASHGHITVNGRKTTVPSRTIKVGDVIAIREGSRTRALFDNFTERFAERSLASWLTWDPKTMAGGITMMPTTESADPAGDLSAVLSFYSR
ncbi:MAG TPA: 30S ribosomal protein S4 [Candidatus Paceibacterota bacterium]|jgi:small subunit ribosomal protein S4